MAFKLLGNRVAILPDPVGNMVGSFFIPGQENAAPETGTVTHLGPGRYEYGIFIHPTVEVGQKVRFQARAGVLRKDDGIEYLIMGEQDIESVLYTLEKAV